MCRTRKRPLKSLSPAWPVLVVIALSGMTALGAEGVWARLLSLTPGGTVYTFSLILAAFLIGLGLGSGAGSFLARSIPNPRVARSPNQAAAVVSFFRRPEHRFLTY